MAKLEPSAALIPFGFTGLESQIYAFLVSGTPATGYRVAQAIGKPVANTYKAIQALQSKGAIVVEDGESRLCRAVPSDELFNRLSREFDRHRAEAKETLSNVAKGEEDDRVYSIRSNLQAIQRARQMLAGAKGSALLAGRSKAVAALREELTDAGGRGAEVAIKTDAEFQAPRVDCFVVTRDDDLLKHGDYFRLVTDGQQFLAGSFGEGEDEAELIYSRSRTLARLMHEGLAAEIAVLALSERLEDGAGPKRLARALTQVKPASSTMA